MIAQAIQEILRREGYVTVAEREEQERLLRSQQQPSSRSVTHLRRPFRRSSGLFSGFPRKIPVPPHLQEALGALGSVGGYRDLQSSATLLYLGELPQYMCLRDNDLPIWSNRYLNSYVQWCLTMCLQHAPDDQARENAVAALRSLLFLTPSGTFAAYGAQWVAAILIHSRVASSYQAALAKNAVVRDALRNAVTNDRTNTLNDPSLERALEMPSPPA